jgi:hypothetical protein
MRKLSTACEQKGRAIRKELTTSIELLNGSAHPESIFRRCSVTGARSARLFLGWSALPQQSALERELVRSPRPDRSIVFLFASVYYTVDRKQEKEMELIAYRHTSTDL